MLTDFEVRVAEESDIDGVLAALSNGYGRPFTREWFDWKHRESPWGASRCVLAEDGGGLLGVVFSMPWNFSSEGSAVVGWRMVDGATTVRAQRRGVFRAVVAQLLQECRALPTPGVVLATATPEARLAHIKNGAEALDPIRAYYRSVRWSRGEVFSGNAVLGSWVAPAGSGVATAWDSASLIWRLDARSGAEYEMSRLAGADRPHGVIHRTVGTRARTLVVTASWGQPHDVRRLVRALAWRDKTVAVLSNAGEGTTTSKPRLAVARGGSLICVWDQRSKPVTGANSRSRWALDGLDLEGVI